MTEVTLASIKSIMTNLKLTFEQAAALNIAKEDMPKYEQLIKEPLIN